MGTAEYTGRTLRALRCAAGVSIRELAAAGRVSATAVVKNERSLRPTPVVVSRHLGAIQAVVQRRAGQAVTELPVFEQLALADVLAS